MRKPNHSVTGVSAAGKARPVGRRSGPGLLLLIVLSALWLPFGPPAHAAGLRLAALAKGARPAPALPIEPVLSAADGQLQAMLRSAASLIEGGQVAQAEAMLNRAEQAAQRIRSAGGLILVHQFQAQLYAKQGRFDLAEPMLRTVVADIERRSGRGSAFAVSPLHSLGAIYLRQHRLPEAESVTGQALALARRAYGANDRGVAEIENTLAAIALSEGQPAQAEALLQHALAVFQGAGDRLSTAQVSDTLATLYLSTGRKDLARSAYAQALVVETQLMGAEHAIPLATENNLAVLDRDAGQFGTAEPAFRHVLAAYRALLGEDNPDTLRARNSLAWLELDKGDPGTAIGLFRSSYAGYTRLRGTEAHDLAAQSTTGVGEYEVARTVLGLLDAAWALSKSDPGRASALREEAFEASQAVHRSVAADALAQTSARLAAGSAQLATLIRKQQDLATQWRATDATLVAALGAAASGRDAQAEADARSTLDSLTTQIAGLDRTIAQQFPRYATLVDPPPATATDVQKVLRPEEVLVEIVTFSGGEGNGTYVWLVGAGGVQWRRVPATFDELSQVVTALRCGLDSEAWKDEGGKTCTALVGPEKQGELPPFDYKRAASLFDTLFGDLRPAIEGKAVMLVLPEPLSSLPFQVLLTGPADPSQPRTVPWFGRSNPLSVLPSVASLGALRSAVPVRAPEPFIGFGNPALNGSAHCSNTSTTFSACPTDMTASSDDDAAFEAFARNARLPSMQGVMQDGRINLEVLRSQCPLPETEFQLRCTAQSLRAPQAEVHVGPADTVTAVEEAALERYRVIVFATHGLLASDTQMLGGSLEPALLMTPPEQPTPQDQGLLTASAIAQLRLNADWVVLTACNTAQPGSGGEAMSGLASAFLYAGARTVLASHWAVFTVSTVLLASNAFLEVAAHPEIGRAEAMRRAMVSLMDSDGDLAHPAMWAPFTVVGEPGPL